MNGENKEKGMTLVVVLLIITVFTILGLAVLGASINNMKQVTKTESSIKTTNIAEMGIQYYTTEVQKFLHEQLTNKETQEKILQDLFAGSKEKTDLLKQFKERFANKINEIYKDDPLLFTKLPDHLLDITTVDTDKYFRIKIDPNGITKIDCADPSENKICFKIPYESYGYTGTNSPKHLKATYTFSYTLNEQAIQIVPATPPDVDSYKELEKLIPDNLSKCEDTTTFPSSGNKTITSDCYSTKKPQVLSNINLISDSLLVFKEGLELSNINHGFYKSSIFVYGNAKIGQITPKDANQETDLIIFGNAKLTDKIMQVKNFSIYIAGDADLTGFELKDTISTKVCIKGEVTPASMRNIENVYSDKYSPDEYKKNCMVTPASTVGELSLVLKDGLVNAATDDKPEVIY